MVLCPEPQWGPLHWGYLPKADKTCLTYLEGLNRGRHLSHQEKLLDKSLAFSKKFFLNKSVKEENTRVPSQSLHFDQNLCSPVQTPQHLREKLLKLNIGSFERMGPTHEIFFPNICGNHWSLPWSWRDHSHAKILVTTWKQRTYDLNEVGILFTLPIIRICQLPRQTGDHRSLDIDPQLLDELFKVGDAQTNIPGMTMRKQLPDSKDACYCLWEGPRFEPTAALISHFLATARSHNVRKTSRTGPALAWQNSKVGEDRVSSHINQDESMNRQSWDSCFSTLIITSCSLTSWLVIVNCPSASSIFWAPHASVAHW